MINTFILQMYIPNDNLSITARSKNCVPYLNGNVAKGITISSNILSSEESLICMDYVIEL
jgi:hypothetical protein